MSAPIFYSVKILYLYSYKKKSQILIPQSFNIFFHTKMNTFICLCIKSKRTFTPESAFKYFKYPEKHAFDFFLIYNTSHDFTWISV